MDQEGKGEAKSQEGSSKPEGNVNISIGPKNVLITGAAGFIGSNTICHLVRNYPGTRFIALDKLNYCASEKNFQEIKDSPNFHFVKGDITSVDLVNYVMKTHEIDTVMHFAAQSHVDNSFGNSLDFTVANVLGTHVLLESARMRKDKLQKFIHVSTDEVYGESTLDDERCGPDSALNPTNPYAATKVSAEFLCKSYRRSFGLPIIITRGNNVYGPKQYPEKLIPKFMNLLMLGHPCPLHGDGKNRRSFLYVDDVARAFEVILMKGIPGEIYNIGSRLEMSNLETLRSLLRLFNLAERETDFICFVKDRAFNDFRYHIDPSSLESLGWSPLVDFEEGLKATKKWYTDNPNHWADIKSALTAHPVV